MINAMPGAEFVRGGPGLGPWDLQGDERTHISDTLLQVFWCSQKGNEWFGW